MNVSDKAVTKKVSEIDFMKPCKVGDIVEINCHVTERGRTSIDLIVQSLNYKDKSEYCSCSFTFVNVGEDGKSTKNTELFTK